MHPHCLRLGGAIIAAIGVFWASVRNAASQREIIGLNRQLAEKSDQIAKLNEKLADLVTGGNGFAYADLFGVGLGELEQVVLINDTDYPLYDLSVRLVNVAKMEELMDRAMTPENRSQWESTFRVGNLGPRQSMGVTPIRISSDVHELRYNIFVTGRNGEIVEEYRARKINGL
jgi:hypothetical protein